MLLQQHPFPALIGRPRLLLVQLVGRLLQRAHPQSRSVLSGGPQVMAVRRTRLHQTPDIAPGKARADAHLCLLCAHVATQRLRHRHRQRQRASCSRLTEVQGTVRRNRSVGLETRGGRIDRLHHNDLPEAARLHRHRWAHKHLRPPRHPDSQADGWPGLLSAPASVCAARNNGDPSAQAAD